MLGQSVDQEDCRHHHGNETDHQPGELVDSLVETGENTLTDDTGSQRSKISFVAGVHRYGGRGSALYIGAHKADVDELQRVLDV